MQKVLLARELSAEPTVVIAASPTRGLDVGAIETVRGLLLDVAGRAPACRSSPRSWRRRSPSLRILVIYEGRIVGEVAVEASARTRHELVTASAC